MKMFRRMLLNRVLQDRPLSSIDDIQMLRAAEETLEVLFDQSFGERLEVKTPNISFKELRECIIDTEDLRQTIADAQMKVWGRIRQVEPPIKVEVSEAPIIQLDTAAVEGLYKATNDSLRGKEGKTVLKEFQRVFNVEQSKPRGRICCDCRIL